MSDQPELFELQLSECDSLGDPVIWRYMAFHKFQDLLNTGSLFFTHKAMFSDFLEGSFGEDHKIVGAAAAASVAALPDGSGPPINDEDDGLVANRTIVQHPVTQQMNAIKASHASIGVNCWSRHASESVALWKSFGGHDEGIAIRSSLARFKAAMSDDDVRTVYAGQVRYVGARPQGLIESPYRSLLYKSFWYEFEQELRFMKQFPVQEREPVPAGWSIPVDLGSLIDRIVIHPMAGKWFLDLVRTSVEKACLSADIVEHSAIRKTASRL
jgi:hypothetical protein